MRAMPIIVGALLVSGCCGQLKEAGSQHATTTHQVAQTLQAAEGRFGCEAIEDPAKKMSCETAAGVVKQQAEVLIDAAQTLQEAMK